MFLFIDRSTRLPSIDDIKTKPRGGMVTSLFRVTDYISSKGHTVYVLSDVETPGITEKNTRWVTSIDELPDKFDAIICNRGTGSGHPEIKAKRRILWTHDLPHSGFIPNPKTAAAFETVFMSRYSEKAWRTFYKDIGKSHYIPNGVDERFFPREKDYNKVIYFSHPGRGLKRLGFIADCVRSRLSKDISFDAYSGVKGMYPMDEHIPIDIDYPGEVNILEPLPWQHLAEKVGTAGLCVLPTGMPETCSNSVLQALKSGTPVVTTGKLGSVPEWVKHGKNGLLTRYLPNDYMVYTVEIVRLIVNLLSNRKSHEKMCKMAAKTKIFTWDEIGQKWLNLLTRGRV